MPMLGDILLNVVKTETYNMKNNVTDHTVEKGVNVADHIRHDPLTINLSCVIGNREDKNYSAQHIYEQLKKMWQEEKIYTYIGNLDKYDNMAITSLNPSRDVATSNGFSIDIELKQITMAQAQVIILPKKEAQQKKVVATTTTQNKGVKQPETRTTNTQPQYRKTKTPLLDNLSKMTYYYLLFHSGD